MRTGLIWVLLFFACRLGHAEEARYLSLEPLCGERVYRKMFERFMERHGAVHIHGGQIALPWSGRPVNSGAVLDAASEVPVEAIDAKDLAAALAADSAYWRVVSLGIILGHTKQVPPKSYSRAEAVNRPATENEIAVLLKGFRK